MKLETQEARIAKDRVMNATGALREHSPAVAQVGVSGAIAYAVLDLANALREQTDPKTAALLRIADGLVDAIADGASEETIKKLAEAYKLESEGISYDQTVGHYIR